MTEFAAVEWERAKRALDSARQLIQSDPDSAASRAYFAAFHALTAVFALRGQTFSKHTAIRAALHRELIQAGLLSKELGKDYDSLADLREVGDYGGIDLVQADGAQVAVEKAAKFIVALEQNDLLAGL